MSVLTRVGKWFDDRLQLGKPVANHFGMSRVSPDIEYPLAAVATPTEFMIGAVEAAVTPPEFHAHEALSCQGPVVLLCQGHETAQRRMFLAVTCS